MSESANGNMLVAEWFADDKQLTHYRMVKDEFEDIYFEVERFDKLGHTSWQVPSSNQDQVYRHLVDALEHGNFSYLVPPITVIELRERLHAKKNHTDEQL